MDEQIAQFAAVTGVDSDRAKFFVESANGDVERAIATYFESGAGAEDDEVDDAGGALSTGDAPASTAEYTGPRTLSGAPAPESAATAASSSSASRKAASGFSASGGRGGIATLRDMQGGGAGAGDEDSDDDDDDERKKPANFFTGGEKSGLSVQNPDRKRGNNEPDIVQNILSKAAEASKRRAEDDARAEPSRSRAFAGVGRTIDSEETPSQQTDPTALLPPRGQPITSEYLRSLRNSDFTGQMPGQVPGNFNNNDSDEEDEVATRRITFWQEGFSVEDGPLCRYDDPQHAETLALINTNRAPLHILNVKFGQRVNLEIEKRTNEKYQAPPPKPMKPFGGSGNRLGAPTPIMVTSNAAASSSAQASQATSATSAPAGNIAFEIDGTKPVTQIQIRLGDGQKMVAKFNHSHTVADVRRYINASHPGMSERDYTLQSSFPPKPLNDESQSLSDAGLINSVVIQKWA